MVVGVVVVVGGGAGFCGGCLWVVGWGGFKVPDGGLLPPRGEEDVGM